VGRRRGEKERKEGRKEGRTLDDPLPDPVGEACGLEVIGGESVEGSRVEVVLEVLKSESVVEDGWRKGMEKSAFGHRPVFEAVGEGGQAHCR
jgi:hypothetical protein